MSWVRCLGDSDQAVAGTEQREFHRVGGEVAIKVDVRILAATNQDLRQLVSIGEFRA